MTPAQKEMFILSIEKFGFCTVRAEGMSMWPLIVPHDRLLLQAFINKPSIGSIVAFFNGNQLIVHRIMWYKRKNSNSWYLWVKGDSSPCTVSKIDSKSVVAVLAHIKRNNRIVRKRFVFPVRIMILPFCYAFLLYTYIIQKKG